jgi:hypothetical protein
VEVGPEILEQELRRDLETLPDRLEDEKYSRGLYRALASNGWMKEGLPGRVALSWRRAEELVNELREQVGQEPLVLEATGREGEVSDDVQEELGLLGWRWQPLDTSHHDPAHLASAEDPPPPEAASRKLGVDPHEWEREAHEEADEEVRRRLG